MKKYTVKELSALSGVSIRTLHHYDQLGLLKPESRTESRYRLYGESELVRLQQILFYRELEFPLKEIIEVLNDPEFNVVVALRHHKNLLQAKQQRMNVLLHTIDQTILKLTGMSSMTDADLYNGLSPETAASYRRQATTLYGEEVVQHAEETLKTRGKEGFKILLAQHDHIRQALRDVSGTAPGAFHVQALIRKHYHIIRQLWGTENCADPQLEAYKGLGQLYLADERFTALDGKPDPVFADFLCAAMAHFASEHPQ